MLPSANIDLSQYDNSSASGENTYKIDSKGCEISGKIAGLEAVKQAVYFMLNTERGQYPIYSDSYGVSLSGLIGCDSDYAMSELKRRITAALSSDERINGADNFEFEKSKGKIHCSFTVRTKYGDISSETDATI